MQFSGSKAKALRQQRGMTQHQVAKAIDTHPKQVNRWENGHAQPGGFNLVLLLRTLGAELEEVID